MEDIPQNDRRPLAAITRDLAKPIPKRLIETKPATGGRSAQQLKYIPWYRCQKVLDHYTNGFWHYYVKERQWTQTHVVVTVQIDIEHADGVISRQAMGMESAEVSGYGTPIHNAESQAFRRAAARFGVAIDLYEGD